MNIGIFPEQYGTPTFSVIINDDIIQPLRGRDFLNMSSIIVEYTPTNTIIASDSRCSFTDGSYFDYYPKIFIRDDAIIAIAGVNNILLNNREIGEALYDYDYENNVIISMLCGILSRQLPRNKRTDFILIERRSQLSVSLFSAMRDTTSSRTLPYENSRFTLGVNFSAYTNKEEKFTSDSEPDLERMKRMIKIDEEADKIVRKRTTVGGPIQAYKMNLVRIEDLSDKNAPKDFSKYYEWKKK